jgi:hypothetical protein
LLNQRTTLAVELVDSPGTLIGDLDENTLRIVRTALAGVCGCFIEQGFKLAAIEIEFAVAASPDDGCQSAISGSEVAQLVRAMVDWPD